MPFLFRKPAGPPQKHQTFRQYTPVAAVFKTVLILASSRKTDLLSNTENLRKFKQLEFRKKAAQPVLQNAKKIKKKPTVSRY